MQALKHHLLSRLSQNFRPEIVYILLVGKFDQIRSIANYYFEESFIESESVAGVPSVNFHPLRY